MDDHIIERKMYQGKVAVKFYGPTKEKPNRHIYTVNGERKTGVTTYLGIKDKSRALIPWAVNQAINHIKENFDPTLHGNNPDELETLLYNASQEHKVKKEKAATIGDKAHKWCQQYILAKMEKAGFPDMPEEKEVQIATSAFVEWVSENKINFMSTEKVVYSRKHDYIGCMDIEAIVNGRRHLVDLKTSSGLYNEVRMQTAAYLMADKEESDVAYKGRWALRLAKETEDEYIVRMEQKGRADYDKYVPFEAMYLDEEKDSLQYDFDAFLHAKGLFEWNKDTDFYYKSKK